MQVSRRVFLALLGTSAVPLIAGCQASDTDTFDSEGELVGLNPNALTFRIPPLPLGTTPVIWLQGSSCSGCSVSLLNRIASQAPVDAKDVLLNIIDLRYHATLMAAAGETAAQAAEAVFAGTTPYLLVVEGAIPTGAGGRYCGQFTLAGVEYSVQTLVTRYASKAQATIAVGTCASFGGMAAMAPNPTGAQPVSKLASARLVNVPGCPTHPDWLVWTLYQLLTGAALDLDSNLRPTGLFNDSVHSHCPRRGTSPATQLGQDARCQKALGCRGPKTSAPCPDMRFNNGVNWCVDANTPCAGCVQPDFPAVGLMQATAR